MYSSFFNLKTKPFQINSDPAFMWTGEKHKEALATLKYGILNNKGFLLLTGNVGTGKTTLINALIQSLDDDIICASVPDSNLEFLDFINYIAFSFGMKTDFSSKGQFVIRFREFLIDAHKKGKKVLLIVDEAQLLTDELLEQIRLLSNIDREDTKLLNIFLVGQIEFNDILSKKNNRAVRQRLTLNYNIDPLTAEETHEYIKHRLKVAGTMNDIFTEQAVKRIHLHSKGFPRRINILCDHCLLSGYVNEQHTINTAIVNECARELEIPSEKKAGIIFSIFNFFSKNKNSNLIETPWRIKGLLLIIFALILCIITTVFYPQSSIIKKKSLIDNTVKPPPKQQSTNSLNSNPKNDVQFDTENDQKKISGRTSEANETLNNEVPLPNNNATEIELKKIIIRFKHNTNDFTAEGINHINQFSNMIIKHPETKIIITGYTDSIGHPEYNKKLSEFRANIVKSFLQGKGITSEKILVRGLGSENPVASNKTPEGRMLNRRVELEVYKNGY